MVQFPLSISQAYDLKVSTRQTSLVSTCFLNKVTLLCSDKSPYQNNKPSIYVPSAGLTPRLISLLQSYHLQQQHGLPCLVCNPSPQAKTAGVNIIDVEK